MNKKLLIFCISMLLFAISCGGGANTVTNSKNGEVKKGITPVADAEIAVIEMETPAYGTVKLELYSNIAPQMVARFKELAKEGYYTGIAFHRVSLSAGVIQAGDANTKPNAVPKNPGKEGDSGKPNVPAEFSDVPFNAGILGAARFGNDINSQNSQFFIMLKREAAFDNKYTVFGKVIEGMNNVVTISGVPKDGEKPQEPVRIKNITIVAK